tara:strand:- start:1939 stop:3291 length:1353 start_codon:yes stop_codon:yes gene_type:complete
MTTPYIDYRKITSKEQLDDYIKEIENGLLIYGEPKHKPSPINKEDALIVVFDEKGKQVKLKHKYYMTPEGHKYRLDEKNEKIKVSENNGGRYELTLANGKIKKFQVHHLELMSYFPHLDWKPFCENLSKKGGTNVSTIDHILQDKNNKKCHYKYLEAVPHTENAKRNNIFNDKEKILKQAQSKGKPFIMTIDEKQIEKEFYSTREAVDYLKSKCDINILSGSISGCLLGAQTTAYNRRLKFNYTEEYLNSQDNLPNEIWKTLEECYQKDEIINRYKKVKGRISPKAISNKGRIITNKGKITNGNKTQQNDSTFNGVRIHTLVWLAFSDTKIEDKLLLHDDKHYSNTFDKNGKVIRYSNWFETLRLGTHKENMEDMSKEIQRVKELDPKNEFIVCNKDGNEVMRSHFVPDCIIKLNKEYPEITFDSGHIRKCLKKERKTHLGFTFKKVIEN